MEEVYPKLTLWISLITLLIAIIALIYGTGFISSRKENSDQKVEKSQKILNDFLFPLKSILDTNKRFHKQLTADSELKNLEYAPDYLQQHFQSLPNSNTYKLKWKTLIEEVIADNSKAVGIIRANLGNIINKDFKKVCDEFIANSKEWEAVWNAVLKPTPVPDSMHVVDKLLAPAFPKEMDSLLVLEIEEREKLAGK